MLQPKQGNTQVSINMGRQAPSFEDRVSEPMRLRHSAGVGAPPPPPSDDPLQKEEQEQVARESRRAAAVAVPSSNPLPKMHAHH